MSEAECTIEAWYMDELDTDQREPHRCAKLQGSPQALQCGTPPPHHHQSCTGMTANVEQQAECSTGHAVREMLQRSIHQTQLLLL